MKVIETGIVYANPKPYLRTIHAFHPSIVDLGNQELLCGFSLAQAPEAVDYLGYQSRSIDGGKTWQFEDRTIPVNTVRASSHTVRYCKTSVGLVAFGGNFWRDDPEKGLFANRENLGFVPMDLIMVRSQDKGKTWSWPEIIVPPLDDKGFEICHSIVELPDGSWIAPTSTQRIAGREFNGKKALVLISKDKGASWKNYGIAFDGTEEGITHWEISVCSLDGKDLLAVSWPYQEATAAHLPTRFAVSHDGGHTFEPFGEIGIAGQTCKVLRLKDGKILLAYRRIDKPGLWASLFDFNGSAWTLLQETPVWGSRLADSGMTGKAGGSDELSALKFGYPQMLQLESGEVFLVFWCFEDWSCCIRWAKIKIEGA